MSDSVYLNGAFVAANDAKISVYDRGFLFGDGIYEVCAVLDGKLIDNESHLARLDRSAAAIQLRIPLSHDQIKAIQKQLVALNAIKEGLVYLQATRGVQITNEIAERDFAFPDIVAPTLLLFTQAKKIIGAPAAETGVSAISTPDLRWARRDIKSVALLAQVLAKQQAKRAGCAEALLVEEGFVTEAASSTPFIITATGEIVTRQLSSALLPGCTRLAVLRLANEAGYDVVERAFTIAEAQAAAECFYTSASAFVMPIVQIDGRPIGDGRPGPLTKRLRALYIEAALRTAD